MKFELIDLKVKLIIQSQIFFYQINTKIIDVTLASDL